MRAPAHARRRRRIPGGEYSERTGRPEGPGVDRPAASTAAEPHEVSSRTDGARPRDRTTSLGDRETRWTLDDIRTEAAGATFSFRTVSGEVLGTDQRSDSYMTGNSRTVIHEGSGGGHGHVSTEVVVTRDIWFRDVGGQEHHVRVARDVPVRVGQHVAVAYLAAERPATGKTFAGIVSIHVLSTDRYWTVRPLLGVATGLVEPDGGVWETVGTMVMWLGALALCFVLIGIPLLIALFVVGKLRERKKKALAAEIAKAMEASHVETLRLGYSAFQSEQKRLAEARTNATVAIGATS